MVLHLKKLCVGVSTVDQLREYIAQRQARGEEIFHTTRQYPRRADEILLGGDQNGSLYWVINKKIQARQRILEFRQGTKRDGTPGWHIVLDPKLILVSPLLHGSFQGWRYLSVDSAPADVFVGFDGLDLPLELAFAVREFGVL